MHSILRSQRDLGSQPQRVTWGTWGWRRPHTHLGHGLTPEADDITPEEADNYVNAKVKLPHAGSVMSGIVRNRKCDSDGNLQGTANSNPIMDTRIYEVIFPDGEVAEYTANVIAENMWAQCDLDGKEHLLMESVVNYKSDRHTVKFADRFVTSNGKWHLCKTTKGCGHYVSSGRTGQHHGSD